MIQIQIKFLSIVFLIASVLISGCATSYKKILNPNYSKTMVFPYGLYRHEVELSLPAEEGSKNLKQQSFRFNGLVKTELNQVQTIALSPMGITVFKILDNLNTGEIKCEIYIDQVKKYESKLLEFYALTKKMLLLKSDAKADPTLIWEKTDSEGRPLSLKTRDEPTLHFSFSKYDDHHIPESVSIVGKQFSVMIKIGGYEIQ